MFSPRRFLPSIPSLLALEAVDRLGSATAAAEDLALTHSAVSRQIKVLEGQVGVRLVTRDGARLKLTPAARDYCQKVRAILGDLSRSTLTLRVNPSGGGLNLGILPAFGLHWLAPRLEGFALAHPEVTVNLLTTLAPFNFERSQLDAALHYGIRDWHGVHYLKIAGEHVLPVCAPDFLDREIQSADDLLSVRLLHLETRPNAWTDWFAQNGTVSEGMAGMLLDQFSTMAQAAAHGMGVALLPDYLANSEIRRGRLIRAFGAPQPTRGNYYLVWPREDPPKPRVQSFVAWMKTVI